MKKIILTLAVFASVMTAHAQTDQGRLFINGQFGFSSRSVERDEDEKTSSFDFSPNIGYFIADRFAIGLGLGIGTRKSEDVVANVETSTTTTNFSIAPFARYYVPTAGEKFHFFAQATLGLGFESGETRAGSVTVDFPRTQTVDFSIAPGFAYFPSDHWSLELALRGLYVNSRNPENDNNNSTEIGLNVNSLSPRLGISYFF